MSVCVCVCVGRGKGEQTCHQCLWEIDIAWKVTWVPVHLTKDNKVAVWNMSNNKAGRYPQEDI